jgi:hypothetical protein
MFEALPIGAPGIVDVDVRVDKARQDDEVADIQVVRIADAGRVRLKRNDRPIACDDPSGLDPLRQDDTCAADRE